MSKERHLTERHLTAEDVRLLSAVAGLPLSTERSEQLAPQLNAWLAAADMLRERMSQTQYADIAPVTGFKHHQPPKGGD
jgi:hypothetical protein